MHTLRCWTPDSWPGFRLGSEEQEGGRRSAARTEARGSGRRQRAASGAGASKSPCSSPLFSAIVRHFLFWHFISAPCGEFGTGFWAFSLGYVLLFGASPLLPFFPMLGRKAECKELLAPDGCAAALPAAPAGGILTQDRDRTSRSATAATRPLGSARGTGAGGSGEPCSGGRRPARSPNPAA